MSFLLSWLVTGFQWIINALGALCGFILQALLTACADLLSAIPAPGFFASAAGWASSTPPLLQYVLTSLNISTGLGIIITAYVLRFLIRRIPFIG